METITIKEALNQGYKRAGKNATDWQSLHKLEDLTDEDIEMEDGDLVLFSKEFDIPGITDVDLRDLIADHIEDQWCEKTGDDTEEVSRRIKEIDFSLINKQIDDKLKDKKCYWATDIQLVKE